MILLILFVFAVVILAGLLVTFGFVFYFRSRQLPAPEDQRINLYPPDPEIYQPLFAPGRDEIRPLEHAESGAAHEQAPEAE